MNARVGEKSPALVTHCTLTTIKSQELTTKKKQILRIEIRILIKLFYKLYNTYFIDIANDNECIT